MKPEKGTLGKRKSIPVGDYIGKKVDVRVNGKLLKGVVVGLAYESDRTKRITTKLSVRLNDGDEKVTVKTSKAKPRSGD